MNRIIAGELGGRRLRTPPGTRTRPTTDRVREALFSRLESMRGGLHAAVVLDLYAGSGAVGLEALSRGGGRVTLIESDHRALAALRANVRGLQVAGRVRVVAERVERVLARPAGTGDVADVVFADPPYTLEAATLRDALTDGALGGWFAADALLVVERPSRGTPWVFPDGVTPAGERRYGETTLWYGRRGLDAT